MIFLSIVAVIAFAVVGWHFTVKHYVFSAKRSEVMHILDMGKNQATSWLNTKNPGCNLQRPVDLTPEELTKYLNKIKR